MKKAIKKEDMDNIATVLEDVNVNEIVVILDNNNKQVDKVKALESIPFGNKIALKDINNEEDIFKCGYIIGKSTKIIPKGKLVHVHNVKSQRINFPNSIIKEILGQMGLEEKIKELGLEGE